MNMTLRRILAGILCGLMAVAAAGCTDQNSEGTETTMNDQTIQEDIVTVNTDGVARSVAFTDVVIRDAFWSARQKQFVCSTVLAGVENGESYGGGVQVPNGLKIQYWDGSKFVDVKSALGFHDFPKNEYATYTFDKVTTTKIRLVMDNSQTQTACGIVEWKLIGTSITE